MRPVVGGLQAEFPDQFIFERYDFDVAEQRQTAIEVYGLLHHPGFVIFDRQGNEVDRIIGPVPEDVLRERILAVIQP